MYAAASRGLWFNCGDCSGFASNFGKPDAIQLPRPVPMPLIREPYTDIRGACFSGAVFPGVGGEHLRNQTAPLWRSQSGEGDCCVFAYFTKFRFLEVNFALNRRTSGFSLRCPSSKAERKHFLQLCPC
jgi:hypothetical protein